MMCSVESNYASILLFIIINFDFLLHEVINNNGYKFLDHYGGLFSTLFDTSGASL